LYETVSGIKVWLFCAALFMAADDVMLTVSTLRKICIKTKQSKF